MRLFDGGETGGSEITASLINKIEAIKNLATFLIKEALALKAVKTIDISGGINLHDVVRLYEIDLIRRALRLTGGHQAQAAHLLGLKKTTLNAKIKRYRLDNLSELRGIGGTSEPEHSAPIQDVQ